MSQRNTIFLIVLAIALAALVLLSAIGGQRETAAQVPFSALSSRDNGTLALFEWMEAIAFRPERRGAHTGGLPDEPAVLIVLPALEERGTDWADDILAWVRAGGTVIVAQNDNDFNPLLRELDVEVNRLNEIERRIAVEQPLPNASVRPEGNVFGEPFTLDAQRDHVTHLTMESKPVLISFKEGEGTVFVTTLMSLVTNDGLRNESNARWARAMIGDLPRGNRVILDQTDVSLGFVERPDFNQLLFTTPWGWALLFAAACMTLYLIS